MRMISAKASAISAATHWPTPQAIPSDATSQTEAAVVEPAHHLVLGLQNRAAAKKSDAGDDPLNGAADGVHMQRRRIESHHNQRHQRRPKRYQRMRAHPGRLPPHFAIEADASANRRGGKKAQDDVHCVRGEGGHGPEIVSQAARRAAGSVPKRKDLDSWCAVDVVDVVPRSRQINTAHELSLTRRDKHAYAGSLQQ